MFFFVAECLYQGKYGSILLALADLHYYTLED